MTITLTLDDGSAQTLAFPAIVDRALALAATRHNKLSAVPLTPIDYLAAKTRERLDALLRDYKAQIQNQISQKYDAMTPAQQAAVLAQFGVTP